MSMDIVNDPKWQTAFRAIYRCHPDENGIQTTCEERIEAQPTTLIECERKLACCRHRELLIEGYPTLTFDF
jgi:hypothetical protein